MAGMRGGINPRQMQKAMKQMGISNEVINGATEVIIRLADKEIVISNPIINVMTMKGQKSYQIDGESFERPLGAEGSSAAASFPEEDIEIITGQVGCDRAKAIEALEACDGNIAEAIVKLME